MSEISAGRLQARTRGIVATDVRVAALLLLPLLAGCGRTVSGPPRAAVDGNVIVGGEPLRAGVIGFFPADGKQGPAVYATIREGHYALRQAEGPVLGRHRVEINSAVESDPVAAAGDREEALTQHIRKHGPLLPRVRIPEQFNRRSTLTAEVKGSGVNTLDFRLETK